MLQFPGISVSVKQSGSERPIGHKFFFFAHRLSKYGTLMLVKSWYLVIFPRASLNDLLQKRPPQVSRFVHLMMFSAFLPLGRRLW
jgi:hypothetical protein